MAPKGKDQSKTKAGDKGKGKGSEKDTSKDKASAAGGKLKPATSINVRHILNEKQSKSLEALEALQAGKSFADVARDLSEDKARQGGSLGWKTRGSLIKEFEDVAFALEVSTVNSPKWGQVKTSEGYHILMVEGRK